MIEVYTPTIRRREMDAVLTALVEDRIGPGEGSEILVRIAREQIGFDFCVSVRSPVFALFLALKLLNIEAGKSVIVSALSPRYYINVLETLRLKPLFCDVAESSACSGREQVQAVLCAGARAVVLHHTLGFVPDTASIADLGLPVIEDCSESYGTVYGEKTPGTAIFTVLGLEEKDMLTSGGGALLYATNRRDAAVLRNCGTLPAEYGLPDMNAAMAVVQFREAAKNLAKRREIAGIYTQSSLRTRHKRFIMRDEIEYNNYAFPLILETGMKDVKAYAKKKEIDVESAFAATLAGSGALTGEQCPESRSLSLRTALFPLYPRLRAAEIEKIAKLIGTLP